MTDAGDAKRVVAEAKLETLLENPATVVKALSDGGVNVTDVPLSKRILKSWTMRLQAATGVVATVYLVIPQEVILGVVPPEYVSTWAPRVLLGHVVVTALAKMRNV